MHAFNVIEGGVSECPDVKNYKWRLNPVWHRMLIAIVIPSTVQWCMMPI